MKRTAKPAANLPPPTSSGQAPITAAARAAKGAAKAPAAANKSARQPKAPATATTTVKVTTSATAGGAKKKTARVRKAVAATSIAPAATGAAPANPATANQPVAPVVTAVAPAAAAQPAPAAQVTNQPVAPAQTVNQPAAAAQVQAATAAQAVPPVIAPPVIPTAQTATPSRWQRFTTWIGGLFGRNTPTAPTATAPAPATTQAPVAAGTQATQQATPAPATNPATTTAQPVSAFKRYWFPVMIIAIVVIALIGGGYAWYNKGKAPTNTPNAPDLTTAPDTNSVLEQKLAAMEAKLQQLEAQPTVPSPVVSTNYAPATAGISNNKIKDNKGVVLMQNQSSLVVNFMTNNASAGSSVVSKLGDVLGHATKSVAQLPPGCTNVYVVQVPSDKTHDRSCRSYADERVICAGDIILLLLPSDEWDVEYQLSNGDWVEVLHDGKPWKTSVGLRPESRDQNVGRIEIFLKNPERGMSSTVRTFFTRKS